jgi:hypothetical protein
MQPTNYFLGWRDGLASLIALLANVAVISGIIFAAMQLHVSIEVDRRQTTMNILKPTREEPVLAAIRRTLVMKRVKSLEDTNTERLTADRDLLWNTYDSVAIHYQAGTIDKCLARAHVREALEHVIRLLEYFQETPKSYARIVQMRADMDGLTCSSS